MAEKLEIVITAKDRTKGVFGGLKTGLGSIAKIGAAAAVTGIGAVAAGVAGLGVGITMMAKDAAKLGPIKEAFEGIAEASGESAEEVLKAFKVQSKGMVSNTDLMKNYNLASSLVSDTFANELPEAMGYLTKVAGATGEDMGFMMDSLVRGVGRLSPMILDNLGIQVDLTKAYDDYALSLGKSADELTKTEQQAGLMAQVMSLLAENTKNMPDVSDPFARLGATFDNLKDSVALAIGPPFVELLEGLSVKITEFVDSDEFQAWLQEATKWIEDELVPKLIELGTEIGENLPGYIASLKGAWEGFKPSLEAMKNSFNGVKEAVISLWTWIGWAIERYNTWNTMLFSGGMTSMTSIGVPPGTKMPGKVPGYNVQGIQSYQHGGSFMVGGPSGIDRTPVSFMATRGERVDITPRGGGRGMTLHFHYSPGISLGDREEMETQVIPFMGESIQRYGLV